MKPSTFALAAAAAAELLALALWVGGDLDYLGYHGLYSWRLSLIAGLSIAAWATTQSSGAWRSVGFAACAAGGVMVGLRGLDLAGCGLDCEAAWPDFAGGLLLLGGFLAAALLQGRNAALGIAAAGAGHLVLFAGGPWSFDGVGASGIGVLLAALALGAAAWFASVEASRGGRQLGRSEDRLFGRSVRRWRKRHVTPTQRVR